MKKIEITMALLTGFFLGSRAGRKPYDLVEQQIRKVRSKPQVQEVVDSVKDDVRHRASGLGDKVKSKVGSSSDTEPWPAAVAVDGS